MGLAPGVRIAFCEDLEEREAAVFQLDPFFGTFYVSQHPLEVSGIHSADEETKAH